MAFRTLKDNFMDRSSVFRAPLDPDSINFYVPFSKLRSGNKKPSSEAHKILKTTLYHVLFLASG